MAVLKLQGFSGSVPMLGDRAIEDNYAVESVNTWLYGQELRGIRAPVPLKAIASTTRRVFRVPKRTIAGTPPTATPPTDLTDSAWVEFNEHDVDIVKGMLIEDQFERYYFCSPIAGPRFNTYARMTATPPLPSYKLGVVPPNTDVDAAGFNPARPTIVSITPMKAGHDIYEIEFRIADPGATPSYANPGGTGNRNTGTGTISVSGSTAKFDLGGAVSNATHLINGNLTQPDYVFHDLSVADNTIVFDFGALKIIDQFRWLQADELSYDYWLVEGSTDAITWSPIGRVILGGTPDQTYTIPVLATGYRYYRLKQDISAIIMVTVAYCYTWVNEFGEESAPSLPVIGAGANNGTWTIGNITTPVPVAGYPAYTKKRLYRTLTGGAGNFYRVSEHELSHAIPDGGWVNHSVYVDNRILLPDTALTNNLILESTFWQPPPPNLQGWVGMPNGFLIAFDKLVDDGEVPPNQVKGNNIYMCEPYHFHAWPPQYKFATETPIVGLGVLGQTCVVATQGFPSTVTGVKPATCSFTKATTGEPCLSRGSIVSTPEGIIYASHNGLTMISPSGIQNITDKFITRDEWIKGYVPERLRSVRYNNGYLALRDYPDETTNSGFFLDPTALRVALTEFCEFDSVTALNSDYWSGEVFMLVPGYVFHWDKPGSSTEMTFMPTRWKSKEFQLPYEMNFGAFAIHWDDERYSGVTWGSSELPVGQKVKLTIWANRQEVYSQFLTNVTHNTKATRLPSGFKAQIWQFEIRARVPVYSLHIASTMKELRAA